ncbi:MAG TPA: site-2 protease family protein [Polyangia bacterium]|nr:site-2 protease family protein [Polyangia bacterium]
MNIGFDQIQQAILYLIAFILCVSVHEFGHAWLANRLGDPTPRLQGRLTLSPLHHIDPVGTLLIPFISAVSPAALPLMAWGRPVQTNPLAYTRRLKLNTGRMLVSIAGPAMNLSMALLTSIIIVIAAHAGVSGRIQAAIFNYLVQLNLVLMCFNLLPIPPLDGGAVLAWVLPRSWQGVVDLLQRYGAFILLLLVLSPMLGLPLLGIVMYPMAIVINLWRGGLVWAIGL